jgi:hypothetical protein
MLLGAIAAIAIAGSSCRRLGTRSGDERPPIIISDGSLDIFIDHPSPGGDRGKWDETYRSGVTTLIHKPYGAPLKVTGFHVFVSNGDGSAACKNPLVPFEVTSLKVTYKKPKVDGTIDIDFDGEGNLRAILKPEDGTDEVYSHWRSTKGNSEKLTSVYLNGDTCTFDYGAKKRGIITIVQIY